jgi:hypothetical protein
MDQRKKMLLIALAIPLLALFGALTAYAQGIGMLSPQPQGLTVEKILSSGNGRYVFGQISDSGKDQFMLDTLTGRLWRIAESGDVGIFLRAVVYRNEDGKYSPVPEEPSKGASKKVER